jgi:hypothetical protein
MGCPMTTYYPVCEEVFILIADSSAPRVGMTPGVKKLAILIAAVVLAAAPASTATGFSLKPPSSTSCRLAGDGTRLVTRCVEVDFSDPVLERFCQSGSIVEYTAWAKDRTRATYRGDVTAGPADATGAYASVKPHRKPIIVATERGYDGFYDVDHGHVVGQCSLPDGTGI